MRTPQPHQPNTHLTSRVAPRAAPPPATNSVLTSLQSATSFSTRHVIVGGERDRICRPGLCPQSSRHPGHRYSQPPPFPTTILSRPPPRRLPKKTHLAGVWGDGWGVNRARRRRASGAARQQRQLRPRSRRRNRQHRYRRHRPRHCRFHHLCEPPPPLPPLRAPLASRTTESPPRLPRMLGTSSSAAPTTGSAREKEEGTARPAQPREHAGRSRCAEDFGEVGDAPPPSPSARRRNSTALNARPPNTSSEREAPRQPGPRRSRRAQGALLGVHMNPTFHFNVNPTFIPGS